MMTLIELPFSGFLGSCPPCGTSFSMKTPEASVRGRPAHKL
jgi:hypothetical protein